MNNNWIKIKGFTKDYNPNAKERVEVEVVNWIRIEDIVSIQTIDYWDGKTYKLCFGGDTLLPITESEYNEIIKRLGVKND